MLFGVGLGCLLQMFQNNNVVTVRLILYTQCLCFSRKEYNVTGCYIMYNRLRIHCKLLVSWILQFRWVIESDLCALFCCVVSWNRRGCCAGLSQERWVCLWSSLSYWFLFSVSTWTESMAFFYWSCTLSSSSSPSSLSLELSNSDISSIDYRTDAKFRNV